MSQTANDTKLTIKSLVCLFDCLFKKIWLEDVEPIAALFLSHHPLWEVSRN